MSKKISKENIDEAQIAKWKDAFSGVYKYASSDGKVAYFRTPERSEIEAANSVAATKPLESNAILAKATFLGGDEEIITVDKYFFGLSGHLKNIIKRVEGELTEL